MYRKQGYLYKLHVCVCVLACVHAFFFSAYNTFTLLGPFWVGEGETNLEW